jgi:hypothetical protein
VPQGRASETARFEARAFLRRNAMQPHPRWIAEDDVEAACCADVRKLGGEIECDRPATRDRGAFAAKVARHAFEFVEARAHCRAGLDACAEQITAAQRGDDIAASAGNVGESRIDGPSRRVAFRDGERAGERALANSGRARVSLAQTRERMRRARGCGHDECIARERITHANLRVEIRQRRDTMRVNPRCFDHDRKPEAQFAEPDGGGFAINAEQLARENVATDRGGVARIAAPQAQIGERLEGVHEECTGSARRIDDPER